MSVRVSSSALKAWMSFDDWKPSMLEVRDLASDLLDARAQIAALESATSPAWLRAEKEPSPDEPPWVGPIRLEDQDGQKIWRRYFFDRHWDSMFTAWTADKSEALFWSVCGDDNEPQEVETSISSLSDADAKARAFFAKHGIEVRDAKPEPSDGDLS